MKVSWQFRVLVLMAGTLPTEISWATGVLTIPREGPSGVSSAAAHLEPGPASRPLPDPPLVDGRGSGTVLWHRNLANAIYTSPTSRSMIDMDVATSAGGTTYIVQPRGFPRR